MRPLNEGFGWYLERLIEALNELQPLRGLFGESFGLVL